MDGVRTGGQVEIERQVKDGADVDQCARRGNGRQVAGK